MLRDAIIIVIVISLIFCGVVAAGYRGNSELTYRLSQYRGTWTPPYGMNPIYLSNSSTPGAHTVKSMPIDVMILDGIDQNYIKSTLDMVNPFWRFTIVPPDSSKYHRGIDTNPNDCVDVTGLIVSSYENVMVISADRYTHGIGKPGPSIYINKSALPSRDGLKQLIEHELSHQVGNPDVPGAPPTNQMIQNYVNETSTWGEVHINIYNGATQTSWVVYV